MSPRPSASVLPLLLGWLRRTREVPEAASLILRGSLVTRVLCGEGRLPADVDYLVPGEFDERAVTELAHQIARVPDPATELRVLATEVIWAETPFPGLRAHLAGSVPEGEEQTFQVDFAYGDPLAQAPLPLNVPEVGEVRACPAETLWAWKLHGLTEYGPGKWRAKDLYDLHLLATRVTLDETVLPGVVALAFSSRGLDLSALADFRTRDTWGCAPSSGRKWRAFGRRYGVEADFLQVRDSVRAQVERVLAALE